MKHITQFIDTNLMEAHLKELLEEKEQCKRRTATLRVQISRLKKTLHNVNQMQLDLENG